MTVIAIVQLARLSPIALFYLASAGGVPPNEVILSVEDCAAAAKYQQPIGVLFPLPHSMVA